MENVNVVVHKVYVWIVYCFPHYFLSVNIHRYL